MIRLTEQQLKIAITTWTEVVEMCHRDMRKLVHIQHLQPDSDERILMLMAHQRAHEILDAHINAPEIIDLPHADETIH